MLTANTGAAEEYGTDYSFDRELDARYFETFVQMLQTDDTQLILVDAPVSDIYAAKLEEVGGTQFADLRDWLSETTEYPLIQVDWRGPTTCTALTDCYIDYGHLNAEGAVQFSEALAERLLTDIPDLGG